MSSIGNTYPPLIYTPNNTFNKSLRVPSSATFELALAADAVEPIVDPVPNEGESPVTSAAQR